ncbi:hypothetical protein SDC9_37804 [bioreactor metagenome]|jgi:hypothetical protein|uniref:Outer membrane protein beta-barrel domain-containing protein n=1 Tax=bioreactor metagenome TaxID=1076179 RepID=A0A644VKF6_9ZZZZ|nr:porin family protein [Paludibacter sp.]
MKRILFSTVFLLFVTIVSAQFNFGLKAGYNSSLSLKNLSSLSNGSYTMDNVKSEMWNNFQAGAFARVFINKFYIQPEILYSVQKKEYELKQVLIDEDTRRDVNTYMNISNVEVPILLGYKLLDLKVLNVRAFAGPRFTMNSGSSLQYENLTEEQITTAGLVQDFKDSQVSIDAGVGVDLFMFALDARVNLIQDFQKTSDLKNISMPTNTFVISLAWKIF